MSPTLTAGQDILSFNWFIKPKVGDLVVVQVNGKEIVKRIQNIHDREVFVTGDNLEASTDSRHFGLINMEDIVGKVVYQSHEP